MKHSPERFGLPKTANSYKMCCVTSHAIRDNFTFLYVIRCMLLLYIVCSVSVSAKENDGGVHAAMQSLIRYLLEKKYSHKMPKLTAAGKNVFRSSSDAQDYAKTLGSVEDHTFVRLERTNIRDVRNLLHIYNILSQLFCGSHSKSSVRV